MKSRNAVKYIYSANPIYVHFKKHHCPKCGKRLITAYDSIVINSHLPEAKNYDFSVSDTTLEGDVEFSKSFFKCPSCGMQISFDEMKQTEKRERLKQ